MSQDKAIMLDVRAGRESVSDYPMGDRERITRIRWTEDTHYCFYRELSKQDGFTNASHEPVPTKVADCKNYRLAESAAIQLGWIVVTKPKRRKKKCTT